MSLNLSLHIEIKVTGVDGWLHWNHPPAWVFVTELYDLVSGQNNDMKDMLADITPTVQWHWNREKEDVYCVARLNAREIAKFRKKWQKRHGETFDFDKEMGFLVGRQFDMFEFPSDFEGEIEDVRFVLWFM